MCCSLIHLPDSLVHCGFVEPLIVENAVLVMEVLLVYEEQESSKVVKGVPARFVNPGL